MKKRDVEMVATVCYYIIIAFGIWLIGVSLFGLTKPSAAIKAIGFFASNNFIHFGEMFFRGLVGIAFIITAAQSPAPQVFNIIGWGLAVSAAILAILPRRWHASYAVFWAKNMPPSMVYVFTPFSLAAGIYLVYQFASMLI